MTAIARRVGGPLRHEVDVNGRHVIVTDEPASLGGDDTGPAPHELLPATLAACVATMISLYAGRHGWDVGDMVVHVTYDPDAIPRDVVVDIQLPAGLADEQVARLRRVAETCPVRRALEAEFHFDDHIGVTDDGRPVPRAA